MKFIHEFTCTSYWPTLTLIRRRPLRYFTLIYKNLPLCGFKVLDALTMSTWDRIKTAFYDQFCSVECNTPQSLAEEAAYENLKLSPTQLVEDYHAVIVMKGWRLGKTEADLASQIILRTLFVPRNIDSRTKCCQTR